METLKTLRRRSIGSRTWVVGVHVVDAMVSCSVRLLWSSLICICFLVRIFPRRIERNRREKKVGLKGWIMLQAATSTLLTVLYLKIGRMSTTTTSITAIPLTEGFFRAVTSQEFCSWYISHQVTLMAATSTLGQRQRPHYWSPSKLLLCTYTKQKLLRHSPLPNEFFMKFVTLKAISFLVLRI